ncbi:MAG TPA: NfeD family protein [Nitrososphaerales archaeon]|nr:NfeD family protein [Nitrososphaerales archaeon]
MDSPEGHPAGRTLFLTALAAAFALSLAVSFEPRAAASQPSTVVVDFSVPVDPGSSSLVSQAVSTAESSGAPAILIEMNTPGGLLSDMTGIIDSIEQANQSGIPTYTYVPPDALAASAGSYIAMATNKILMGPGSEIGPSTPIVVGGTDLEQNHTEGAMLSLMASLAEKWGRNATAAQTMVLADTAYSASDAYRFHLVQGNATSLEGALASLGLGPSYVVVHEGAYDQLLSALSDPNVSGLLVFLGGLAILLDLYHPTFVLSVAGGIALVAGLVGIEAVGASTLGLAVVAAGIALMFLELRLGHGLAMVAGGIVSGAGIYLLFQGLQLSSSSADLTQVEAVAVAVVGVLAALYVRWVVGPLREGKSVTGPESIVGKVGVAYSSLTPNGEVRVEGITWRARSASGDVAAGESVRVDSIEGLVLVVVKA